MSFGVHGFYMALWENILNMGILPAMLHKSRGIPVVGHRHFADPVKFPGIRFGEYSEDTLLLLKHMGFPIFFHQESTPWSFVRQKNSRSQRVCEALQCPICIRTRPRPSTRPARWRLRGLKRGEKRPQNGWFWWCVVILYGVKLYNDMVKFLVDTVTLAWILWVCPEHGRIHPKSIGWKRHVLHYYNGNSGSECHFS